MGLKLFELGGIDNKSNDLLRDPKNLRDSLNIKYSIIGEYEKRFGTDTDTDFSGDTYNDVIFIKSLGEYFFRNGSDYYSYKNGIKKTIHMSAIDPTTDPTSDISGDEYLNTFIFTHVSGQRGTYKYDGRNIYKAGLPVPEFAISFTGGVENGFLYTFFDFIDNQGNQIFGPGRIDVVTQDEIHVNLDTLKGTGFSESYIKVTSNVIYNTGTASQTLTTITGIGTTFTAGMVGESFIFADGTAAGIIISFTSATSIEVSSSQSVSTQAYSIYGAITASQTLTESARDLIFFEKSDDILVGTKVAFRPSSDRSMLISCITTETGVDVPAAGYSYFLLEIESISGNTITFTAASLKDKKVIIYQNGTVPPVVQNIMGNMVLRKYFSLSETTGYVQGLNPIDVSFHNTIVDSSVSSQINEVVIFRDAINANVFLMSDTYDITTSKLRPPKCKYIKTYGNQLVFGSVLVFYNFNNKETNYTNNDLIMYSDILTGDLAENLSESNRQLIGNTYDGEITGLARVKDSLVVFKDRSIFALDGILFSGSYQIRKIETDEIGCTSNKSILVIKDNLVFQGIDGLYGISGINCEKISTRIDKFFTDEVNSIYGNTVFDASKTRSVMDNLNENYYFFTNKAAIVYNFEFKQWLIWDLKNALNGLTVDNSGSIRMFSGSTVKKFIAAKNDSGSSIDAWIKIAWLDFGEPSLLKKFVDVRYFSINNVGQVLTSRLYRDWDESKVKADFTIDMSSSSTKTVLRKLDIQKAQSVSLFIGNNVIDEDMNLTGIEINGTIEQDKDKNVK